MQMRMFPHYQQPLKGRLKVSLANFFSFRTSQNEGRDAECSGAKHININKQTLEVVKNH